MIYSRQNALVTLLAGIGLCSAVAAHADEGMSYKFSGFGTIGAVVTDSDQVEFRSSMRQMRGATKSTPDFGVDSRVGLQANVKFNDTFSAVGQVLTSRRDDTDAPQVEWLFAQAAVTPWLDLRAGRMVLPVFLLSDTRSVGYAQHWLRAPQEAYSLYLPSSFDGVMAHFKTTYAGTNFNVQLSTGKADAQALRNPIPFVFTQINDKIYSVNVTAEQGDWLFRIGRTEVPKMRIEGAGTVAFSANDAFTGAGIQYDNGKLLVISEYLTRRTSDCVFFGSSLPDGQIDSNMFYVSAGYRIGNFMPYATASLFKKRGDLNLTDDATQAIGVRWDMMKNVALKTQLEHARSDSATQFVDPTAPVHGVNVLSVAVDFVF